jgi:hypothetical protein
MLPFKKYLIVLEGGAAGHMAHPFDLPTVNRGTDLVNFFKKALVSLKRDRGAVKFDGLNMSLKLIQDDEGNYRFALDRGSNKEIDIQGITLDNIEQRFDISTGGGQSMINVGKFILPIMDSAIELIMPELKKLKMAKNSNRFLNTEYITGKTNVTQYDRNMIVFHGINEFYLSKSPVKGSIGRASREVAYDSEALNTLVLKLKPVFNQHGFEVFGPTKANITQPVSLDKVLSEPFKVIYTPTNIVTQPLSTWLKKSVNPRAATIIDVNGKKITAMTKNNYLHILNGNPLELITTDPKAQKLLVDGAVIYHATRILGNEVLKSLGSSAGELTKHEGVVLRDPKISMNPVKITGEFIVRGLESEFRKK